MRVMACLLISLLSPTVFAGGNSDLTFVCKLACPSGPALELHMPNMSSGIIAADRYKSQLLNMHNDFVNGDQSIGYSKKNDGNFSPTEKIVRGCLNSADISELTFSGIVVQKISKIVKCDPMAPSDSGASQAVPEN